MICIPEWRKAILSCAVLALPFVAGCGGGDDPGPINAAVLGQRMRAERAKRRRRS